MKKEKIIRLIRTVYLHIVYNVYEIDPRTTKELTPDEEVCLNDIILHRNNSFTGRDPEPKYTEWISQKFFKMKKNNSSKNVETDFVFSRKIKYTPKDISQLEISYVWDVATLSGYTPPIKVRTMRWIFKIPFAVVSFFLKAMHFGV